MIVGLTGGIASGKSLVSNHLKQLGADVIDADLISRKIMEIGSPVLLEVASKFGNEVFNEDGSLNRRLLRSIIINDSNKRIMLNGITHPAIEVRVKDRIANSESKIVVIDAPLLIEAGLYKYCDEIWLMSVPYETQIERLMHRDGISYEDAKKTIDSQMSLDEKKKFADIIIDNSNNINDTLSLVEKLYYKRVKE